MGGRGGFTLILGGLFFIKGSFVLLFFFCFVVELYYHSLIHSHNFFRVLCGHVSVGLCAFSVWGIKRSSC